MKIRITKYGKIQAIWASQPGPTFPTSLYFPYLLLTLTFLPPFFLSFFLPPFQTQLLFLTPLSLSLFTLTALSLSPSLCINTNTNPSNISKI